ncbi:MAG: RnfABCDGE type electron transport complex subunit B [Bacteroidales bacterium]|nr:RnfABCDGE type electron transport complex subunit B [Bacteroidales bacterium]
MILSAVLVLGLIGAIFAVVLFFVAQKFKVIEDPLIDEIAEVLPGANCGGCGKAGCRAMAEAFVKQGNMDGLKCPAGGEEVAQKVAALLGCTPEVSEPQVAVLRCNGSCANAVSKNHYDGLQDCAFANTVFGGESGCIFGCLGLGNCSRACQFGALSMDPETGLPLIDEEKCTACGACVKACPRGIIELRNKGPKNRRVYVACRNKEKGAAARKSCTAACIGCGKCEKTCPFGAIKVENNLAYIDFNVCKLCRKCVAECPTGAIHAVNFPPLPPKKETAASEPSAPAPQPAPKVEPAPKAEPVAAPAQW